MNFNRRAKIAILAAGVCCASIASGWAQPPGSRHDDDSYGVSTHRKDFRLVDPRGQQVDNHSQYRFVVPSSGRVGTFYTYKNNYYYTPVAVAPGQGGRVVVQAPVTMAFGSFKHHDQLAERLVGLTNDLCLDLHHNYRDNRNFKAVYADAYQLMEEAKFMHAAEHRADRQALLRVAPKIDRLFHHIEHETEGWTGSNRRNIGQMHLHAKLEEIEALIHHLMYDLGIKPDHDQAHGPRGIRQ